MTHTDEYFDMETAPISIEAVRLNVRDVETVSGFYQNALGLKPITKDDQSVTLGANGKPLVYLDGDPSLKPRDPRQAGLFHTAFLMPSRAHLASWLEHVAEISIPLQGASDHIVSEAIYLADPEGNGIEVYADRAIEDWRDTSGNIRMATDPLDLQSLLDAADDTPWSGFPEQGIIGHVHLQVGDINGADKFYSDILGLDITNRYPGALFFGSGGYHHQLAANVWDSRYACVRDPLMAGLSEVMLKVTDPERDAIRDRADGDDLADPWGTQFSLTLQD